MLLEQMQTAAQKPLPTLVQIQGRVRAVRRAFTPTEVSGSYQLPRTVHDRLTAILAPVRNREAAYALALFLGRYWSSPSRIVSAFPVDRRALAGRAANLGLTEGQIRGALRTLEAIGFLDRTEPTPGSRYQATDKGLQRKPVIWRFAGEFLSGFLAANTRSKRAQRGKERRSASPGYSRSPEPLKPVLGQPRRSEPLSGSGSMRSLEVPRLSSLSIPNTDSTYGRYLRDSKQEVLPIERVSDRTEPQSGLEAALFALKQAVLKSQI